MPTGGSARVVAVALLGVVVVVGLGALVVSGATMPIDAALIGVIRADEARDALAFLRPLTEAGSTWAVTIVALALLLGLLVTGRPWTGLAAGFTILAASILNTAAKTAVARTRPEVLEPLVEARGFSFPSGHAALGMVAWGIVAVVVARSALPRLVRAGLAAALGALVTLIGVSRVYLGVHYPSDVLAGWVAGAVIVVLFARLTREAPPADPVSPAESRAPGDEAAAGGRGAPRCDPPAPE